MPTFGLDNGNATTVVASDKNIAQNDAPVEMTQHNENIPGLNENEQKDPNAIKIIIENQNIPIVVFFGPPTCGKTMTLIRLSRYLKENGYQVNPVRSFRPGYDTYYRGMCDNFNTMINSDLAQDGNNLISFMLVEVSYKGRPLCQILEAPGEHYFKPKEPNAPFPAYINTISACRNRKLWGFFIEPDHTNKQMEREDRLNYVERIGRFKQQYMHPRDKVAIIFNKIDETKTMRDIGNANIGLAAEKANQIYPGLFNKFANENPITKLFKPTRAAFVPYMNGFFSPLEKGGASFQLGHDNFPRNLWSVIMKSVRG